MNIIQIIDKLRDHLNLEIFPNIKLKQQQEREQNFLLVKPKAYSFYLPAQIHSRKQEGYRAPTAVISPNGDWSDDGQEFSGIIQISLCVYNPGDHQPIVPEEEQDLTLGTEGWRDLSNLMDKIKADLLSRRFIQDIHIGTPWKEGYLYPTPEDPQHYPYHYGYQQFPVTVSAYPAADLSKYL